MHFRCPISYSLCYSCQPDQTSLIREKADQTVSKSINFTLKRIQSQIDFGNEISPPFLTSKFKFIMIQNFTKEFLETAPKTQISKSKLLKNCPKKTV